jgi:hypothetical protein
VGITGSWTQAARRDYTGAAKWGDGYHPIHGVRDPGRGRVVGTKTNLYPLGEPSDAVAAELTGREIDWIVEDYVIDALPAEHYRYQDEQPRWDSTTPSFRDATVGNPAMGEWTSWGVYNNDDPSDIWPRPGPTGGMTLDTPHGEQVEQQRAIAVPTMPVTGGWLGKVRGAQALPESQEAGQPGLVWTINNATVQGPGLKELVNDRALARGTDTPRTSVLSRVAGMVEKRYGLSFGMGGGPGTPDMQPFQQSPGLKRPFFTRRPGLPPDEPHMFASMESRMPLQRATPADPWQGEPEVGPGTDAPVYGDWGY